MGLFKRAAEIVESQVNKFLDKLEDPNATLDLSYEKMLSSLQEVKRHLADVVTEQKRLEMQMANVQKDIAMREEEAKAALKLEREDLATAALERKHASVEQLAQLQQSYDNISSQAERLIEAERKFQDKIASFKTQKEVTKSTYQAAKAEVKISESLTGISKELGGLNDSVQRATDKADEMKARAAAMQSLTDQGVLEDPFDKRDSVTKELEQLRKKSAVSEELERLKKETQGE